MDTGNRPRPIEDPDTAPYWEAASSGQLLLQRCTECRRFQFYPRFRCRFCFGIVEWQQARGVGTVYSYTTVHRSPEAFTADVPYTIVLVDLVEGVRLMGRLVGTREATPSIGQRVRVRFDRLKDSLMLPNFEPWSEER